MEILLSEHQSDTFKQSGGDVPQEENPQINEPRITILYDGFLSGRLNWRTDNLARFADLADLRTYVRIMTGDDMNRPQIQMDKMGDILVWKQVFSVSNLFGSREKGEKSSRVVNDTNRGEAAIFLNHQIIVDEVKDRNEGRVTPEAYTRILEAEVKKGLRQILLEEKGGLLKYTGRFLGLQLAAIVGLPLLAHGQTELIRMTYDPVESNALIDAAHWFIYNSSRVAEYLAAPMAVYGSVRKWWWAKEDIDEDPSLYVQSLRDMNPVKYPVDVFRGLRYLLASDTRLVELEAAASKI